MGKIFGRTLSLLVTFAMVFSVLLVMPVSNLCCIFPSCGR